MRMALAYIGSDDVVFSAGLAADGSGATEQAVAAMDEWGIDLRDHRSAMLTRDMCNKADRILVMSDAHRSALLHAGIPAEKVTVLAGENGGIADPYGGDLACYRHTRDQLMTEIRRLLKADGNVMPMQSEHVAAIADLEKRIFSGAWSHDAIKEELDNPTAFCRVLLQKDGTVVAYILCHHVLDELFIERIATSPDHVRQGFSSQLLKTAKAYAAENGIARITLEVRVSNRAAIALYEKHGFENEGVRPGFYDAPKEDAYIYSHYLSKEVSP